MVTMVASTDKSSKINAAQVIVVTIIKKMHELNGI